MTRRVFTAGNGGSQPPEYRLRRAAERGDLAQVRELLRGPIDVNAADPEGRTALHHAAAGGHLELVDTLLAAGAGVDALEARGRTPLLQAAAAGHAEVVTALVRAGADLGARDRRGDLPLHLAVQGCHEKAIATLLTAGAPVDARGWKRRTVLFYAATSHAGLVRTLLSAGARADARTPEGDTPLHSAARVGSCKTGELLLSAGARVDPVDSDGMTPLALAALAGHSEFVQLLLRVGAKADGSPLARATPLALAEAHGHRAVAAVLAERGGTRRKHPRKALRKPVRPQGGQGEPLYRAASPWLEGDTLEFDLIPGQAPTLGGCTPEFIQACLAALGYPHAPESWSVEPLRTPYYSGESARTPNERYVPAWLLRVRLAGTPPELDNVLNGFPAEVDHPDTTSDGQATHRLLLEREQGVSFVAVGSFSGEVPSTVLSRLEQRLRAQGAQATTHVRAYENARFQLRVRLQGLEFPDGAALAEELVSIIQEEAGVIHWQQEALLEPY